MADPTPRNVLILTTPIATPITKAIQSMTSASSTPQSDNQATQLYKSYRDIINDGQLEWVLIGILVGFLLAWCTWFLWEWLGPRPPDGGPIPEPGPGPGPASTPVLTPASTPASKPASPTEEDLRYGMSNEDHPLGALPSSRPGEEDPFTSQERVNNPEPQEIDREKSGRAEQYHNQVGLEDGGPEESDVMPGTIV